VDLGAVHVLLSVDLPIVVQCVDTADKIDSVLAAGTVGDGPITLERVDVRVY
jgi:PII-like signaling protein